MPASPETLARVQEGIQNMRLARALMVALKDVMAERGIPFTELGRPSLEWCDDPEKVRGYIRRAVKAVTEAEIFGRDLVDPTQG
jgi:hypothetical protein